MRIIAICGAKRTGKDCVANYISENFNYEHVKIAQKLKDMCKLLFSFTDHQMECDIKDDIDPKWGVSPRQCMQFFGTEVMQYNIQELLPDIGRKFWINSLVASMKPDHKYVISDMRFHHEYVELKNLGAIFIRVDRDSVVDTNDTHQSELEYKQLPVDYTIKNNSSKEDLYKAVTRILSSSDPSSCSYS
jgi:hypothetical protein